MKILITGGSGDLGSICGPALEQLGHQTFNLDQRPPVVPYGTFLCGSILDRETLSVALVGIDCIVHIAALHGIHEFRNSASRSDFWDLNVTGTFNLLEGARQAGIPRFIFISSTSISNTSSFYGQTKVLAEALCRAYRDMDPRLSILSLRPRAFIPPWNRQAYSSFIDWAKWFWPGAVHIHDVSQAVIRSVRLVENTPLADCPSFVVDGKYDYNAEELSRWDEAGPGSTFLKRYGQAAHDMVVAAGLDPALKPNILDISETKRRLGYEPSYGQSDLLLELKSLVPE